MARGVRYWVTKLRNRRRQSRSAKAKPTEREKMDLRSDLQPILESSFSPTRIVETRQQQHHSPSAVASIQHQVHSHLPRVPTPENMCRVTVEQQPAPLDMCDRCLQEDDHSPRRPTDPSAGDAPYVQPTPSKKECDARVEGLKISSCLSSEVKQELSRVSSVTNASAPERKPDLTLNRHNLTYQVDRKTVNQSLVSRDRRADQSVDRRSIDSAKPRKTVRTMQSELSGEVTSDCDIHSDGLSSTDDERRKTKQTLSRPRSALQTRSSYINSQTRRTPDSRLPTGRQTTRSNSSPSSKGVSKPASSTTPGNVAPANHCIGMRSPVNARAQPPERPWLEKFNTGAPWLGSKPKQPPKPAWNDTRWHDSTKSAWEGRPPYMDVKPKWTKPPSYARNQSTPKAQPAAASTKSSKSPENTQKVVKNPDKPVKAPAPVANNPPAAIVSRNTNRDGRTSRNLSTPAYLTRPRVPMSTRRCQSMPAGPVKKPWTPAGASRWPTAYRPAPVPTRKNNRINSVRRPENDFQKLLSPAFRPPVNWNKPIRNNNIPASRLSRSRSKSKSFSSSSEKKKLKPNDGSREEQQQTQEEETSSGSSLHSVDAYDSPRGWPVIRVTSDKYFTLKNFLYEQSPTTALVNITRDTPRLRPMARKPIAEKTVAIYEMNGSRGQGDGGGRRTVQQGRVSNVTMKQRLREQKTIPALGTRRYTEQRDRGAYKARVVASKQLLEEATRQAKVKPEAADNTGSQSTGDMSKPALDNPPGTNRVYSMVLKRPEKPQPWIPWTARVSRPLVYPPPPRSLRQLV